MAKTTRKETVKQLNNVLANLYSTGISVRMNEGNAAWLEKYGDMKLDFLGNFLKENGSLHLSVNEFPETFCLDLAFLVHATGYDEGKIFDSTPEFQKLLKKKGGKVGVNIAKRMDKGHLSGLTLEELIKA